MQHETWCDDSQHDDTGNGCVSKLVEINGDNGSVTAFLKSTPDGPRAVVGAADVALTLTALAAVGQAFLRLTQVG